MEKQIKTIPFEIKDINEEERSFLAVASTEDIDRDNDRMMADGWDLGNFLKNPVVPWAHRYGEPPVAKATEIYVKDGKLMFTPKFASKEEYDFADTIFRLYKGGFLRSFSVGFMPKRYEIVEREPAEAGKKGSRGYDYLEQELWEISACTVPSNPNALVAAKAKGVIDDAELEAIEKEVTSNEQQVADKRLEIEKRLDALETLAVSMDSEERSLKERLDMIEETQAEIDKAINREPEQTDDGGRRTEDRKTETPDKQTQTLTLTDNQVSEIVKHLMPVAVKKFQQTIDQRINYHLGIVE